MDQGLRLSRYDNQALAPAAEELQLTHGHGGPATNDTVFSPHQIYF